MFDWIIVGGGIQGCTVANYLIKAGKTTVDKLAIIDPYDKPLSNWKRCTDIIGMKYLRSPSVHHIDTNSFSLQTHAKKNLSKQEYEKSFLGFYRRPSLPLFNEHCDKVVSEVNLHLSWYKGRVNKVKKDNDKWIIHTEEDQEFRSKNMVLAMGISEQYNYPDWAVDLKKDASTNINHIFEKKLSTLEEVKPPIVIIGGGITAAHLAIKASTIFPGNVTLLKRHPFRIHDYDSEPGWLGPKYLDDFQKIVDLTKRRDLITKARYKGSLTKELNQTLTRLHKNNQLEILDDEVLAGSITKSKKINLYLSINGTLKTQTVLFATGFEQVRPGNEWLTPLIQNLDLKCARCGYPVVSTSLEWCPHLYVAGALAELEIGPVARNIAGARKAAERIVSSI